MPHDISLILPSEQSQGAVYLSDIEAARSISTLKNYKIGAIVTVTRGDKLTHGENLIPRYLYLPAEDRENFNIGQYFELSNKFIEESRKFTNVLIHCVAGISRSATLVAAYIMGKYNHTAHDAIAFVKRRRNKISPNRGFREQLRKVQPTNVAEKIQDGQKTLSSPVKFETVRSVSLPKHLQSPTQQNNKQNGKDTAGNFALRSTFTRSTALPSSLDKKLKIQDRIEKVKSQLITKLSHSIVHEQPVGPPKNGISFSTLLQSNIYQNKLRIKV